MLLWPNQAILLSTGLYKEERPADFSTGRSDLLL
jgi:hypothetical protein